MAFLVCRREKCMNKEIIFVILMFVLIFTLYQAEMSIRDLL